jgi:histone chaperone ASF1
VLEEVMVGPVPVGINQFVLEAGCPDYSSIRNEDLIGVTVVLVTCSYMNQEFLRIGYYVRNEYSEPFDEENYPNPVDITKLTRNILVDEPRVTRIPIQWDGSTEKTMTYEGMVMGETDEMQAEDDALDAAEGEGEGEGEEGEDEEGDGNNVDADNDDEEDDNEEIDLESEDDDDEDDEMDQEEGEEEEEDNNPNVESVAEA